MFRILHAIIWGGCLALVGCEREIDVVLPGTEPELVVEGRIESGAAPWVVIGLTSGYFDPVDAAAFAATNFLGGATVRLVPEGGEPVELDAVCTGDLPPEALAQFAELWGLPVEVLQANDLCVYTSFTTEGEPGVSYRLEVEYEGTEATATTRIPVPVPLNDLWWAPPGDNDTLGVLYAQFTDPAEPGHAYRWFSRRINRRPAWDPQAGEVKDADYVAPLGSVVEDVYFNGLSFTFTAFRGAAPNSTAWDDDPVNGEFGFFKRGDTVAVKACGIDPGVYEAVASYEAQILGQGSPFSVPSAMVGNVAGARGLWAGYGVWRDTVACVP